MALLTVSGGVPAGNYTGTFRGVEPQPENREKGYGAGIRWKFCIDAGLHAGQMISRITGPTPSANNTCGMMLRGLVGRPLKEGEEIDPDAFVGRRYALVVSAGPSGGMRVEAIVSLPSA